MGCIPNCRSNKRSVRIPTTAEGTATLKPFEWTADDIKPAIELVLQQFGVERIFCGSDWPVSLLAATYGYTWQQYQLLFDSLLNEAAQQKVYVSNAEKFYNLH